MGAGRKPLPREERRRNRVVLNLTDAELSALEAAAGDVPAALFAREVVAKYLARRRR